MPTLTRHGPNLLDPLLGAPHADICPSAGLRCDVFPWPDGLRCRYVTCRVPLATWPRTQTAIDATPPRESPSLRASDRTAAPALRNSGRRQVTNTWTMPAARPISAQA